MDEHVSGGLTMGASEVIKRGRLACAIDAQEAQDLALMSDEIEAV